MHKYFHFSLFILLLAINCSRPIEPTSQLLPTLEEQRLDGISKLEKSILKITCTAYYENFYYNPPAMFTDSVDQNQLQYHTNITSNSVAATGLILDQDGKQALLLSCHHIFDFPDTVRSYYRDRHKKLTNYLSTLSIRNGLSISVIHKNGRITPAKLITHDNSVDAALIVTSPGSIAMTEIPFYGKFGDADKLKLGQEVNLLGFPKGFFMVTRGLVSPGNIRSKFIVDASFNQGFSGGIVVAFNKESRRFEYVGMANSVAYSAEKVMVPIRDELEYEPFDEVPYKGDMEVRELKMINYGITFILKSNMIADFLKESKATMRDFGVYWNGDQIN